jgi:hypothetical protein
MTTDNAGALALVANAQLPATTIDANASDEALAAALAQLGAPIDSKNNEMTSNGFAILIASRYTAAVSSGILEGLESKAHRRIVQSVLVLGKHSDKDCAKRAQSAISMASKRLRASAAGEVFAWPPREEKPEVTNALQTLKDWVAVHGEAHAAALLAWVPTALADARRTDTDQARVLAARLALPDDIRKMLGL